MHIKTAQEKFAYDVGFDIGHSDNKTQVKLLNGLVDDLYNAFDLELKLLRKELETAKKERDYWKLSFNKQVEASRR